MHMVCCNQIIGVDPYGSILAQPDELNVTDVTSYHVSHLYHCMHSVQYGYVVHFDLQREFCISKDYACTNCTYIHE